MKIIAHAEWRPTLKTYSVCLPGEQAALSRDGFMWFNSAGAVVRRPAPTIEFHGGPKDGAREVRICK